MPKYGFTVELNLPFAESVEKVIAALKTEGFGIVTEIDFQATMKNKLNIDRAPYRMLGACNPQLANQALEADPDIGLLLPCNVVIREEKPGKVVVGFLDPLAIMALVEKPGVDQMAKEVRSRLDRVAASLR